MARDDDDALLVAALAVTLLAMLEHESNGVAWGDGWHWPVPDLVIDGVRYPARVSSGFKQGTHHGVDMMYRRRSRDDRQEWPSRVMDAGGAKAHPDWFAPEDTPVLAARAGEVWSVRKIPTGIWVVIDHGKPWATSYHHLASANVEKGDVVAAGTRIGTMGHNPNTNPAGGAVDRELLRHLHFEAWYRGGDYRSGQDPASVIGSWGRSVWTR